MSLIAWRTRFTSLVPVYFIVRVALLLVFGLLSLACVYLHVLGRESKGDLLSLLATPLGISAMALFGVMMLANLYLLLVYPLRASASYPRVSRHPWLAGLVILSFLLFVVFSQLALRSGANAYVVMMAPAVLVGAVSGLSWPLGITLLLGFNVIMSLLLPNGVEPLFWGFMLCSQWVVYILFKALIGEFHTKTLLFQRLVELQATQRLLRESVERDVRFEIARNLHDELGHLATRLSLVLGQMPQNALQPLPQLQEAQTLTHTLHQQLRSIAASWTGLERIDLKSSLEALVRQISQPQIRLSFVRFDGLCSPAAAEAIFRACQEGITNCLRHSDASRLEISLRCEGSHYQVELQDNGKTEWRGHWGNGLRGIQARLQQLGGELVCSANAEGFCMRLTLPVHAHAH